MSEFVEFRPGVFARVGETQTIDGVTWTFNGKRWTSPGASFPPASLRSVWPQTRRTYERRPYRQETWGR